MSIVYNMAFVYDLIQTDRLKSVAKVENNEINTDSNKKLCDKRKQRNCV